MRILIVEDDTILADAITNALRSFGHVVDALDTGAQADLVLANEKFDVVILDIGLPVLNGYQVLSRLRARRQTVPVLILTARDSVHDRIRGLDGGADDYLTKPFDMDELEARVRALVRRSRGRAEDTVRIGDLVLNLTDRSVSVNAVPIEFTARELAILEVLIDMAGKVVGKEMLMNKIYTWDRDVKVNALEVSVYRIRKKLQHASVSIRNIRGLGYLLESPVAPGVPDAPLPQHGG